MFSYMKKSNGTDNFDQVSPHFIFNPQNPPQPYRRVPPKRKAIVSLKGKGKRSKKSAAADNKTKRAKINGLFENSSDNESLIITISLKDNKPFVAFCMIM